MPIFAKNKKRDDELGDEELLETPPAPEVDAFGPPDDFDEIVGLNTGDDEVDAEEEDPKKSKRKSKGDKKARGGRKSKEEEPEEEEEPEKVDWGSPVKPSLSLPSRAIIEAVDRNAAQQKMKKFFIIATAGLMAFGITAAGLNIYSAGQLEGAKSEGRALDTAVSQLQPIADYSSALQARKDAVSKVLAKGIDYSTIQKNLFEVANKNGVLIKNEGNSASGCMAPSPFVAPTGIGCMTLTVDAANTLAIATFASDLTKTQGIPDAYITGVTNSTEGRANATVSFNYDNKLVSQRYIEFAQSNSAPSTGTGTPSTAPTTTEGSK